MLEKELSFADLSIPLSELHPESNGAVVAVLIPTIFRKSRRFIA